MRFDTISHSIPLESASAGRGVLCSTYPVGEGPVCKFVVIDVRMRGLLLADEIIYLDPRIILKISPQLLTSEPITQISRQDSLKFIKESEHFIKADSYVGFYELLTVLCECF
jgi:hypothetical protein